MREEILKTMLEKADKEHPVTRQEICKTFHVSDRVARRMVEDLREKGVGVCGTSEQEGYWVAKTQEELERFLRDYTSKASTIFRRANKMRSQGGEEGQVSLFDYGIL